MKKGVKRGNRTNSSFWRWGSILIPLVLPEESSGVEFLRANSIEAVEKIEKK